MADSIEKTRFKQTADTTLGFERAFRLFQGAAGLASLAGLNGRMITPLGKTLDFTKIGDRCFDIRMALLSTQIFLDVGRISYDIIFRDVRRAQADRPSQYLTNETAFSIACLVLDASCFSAFYTNHFPLLPKGIVTEGLATALKPSMITVFAIGYARFYHDSASNPGDKAKARTSNKFALDLFAGLVPFLLPKHFGGPAWQTPFFNIATGAYGAYVIYENFPQK